MDYTNEELKLHIIQPETSDFIVQGRIISGTKKHIVADTRQLWDERFQMFQSDINKEIRVEIYSTNGILIKNKSNTCTLYAQVFIGSENITNKFLTQEFSWVRTSDDSESDAIWNSKHQGCGPEITVSAKEVVGSSLFECNVNTQRYE